MKNSLKAKRKKCEVDVNAFPATPASANPQKSNNSANTLIAAMDSQKPTNKLTCVLPANAAAGRLKLGGKGPHATRPNSFCVTCHLSGCCFFFCSWEWGAHHCYRTGGFPFHKTTLSHFKNQSPTSCPPPGREGVGHCGHSAKNV